MRRCHPLAHTGLGSATPSLLRAQGAWPERPVRTIVPFPPGGSADIVAGILQPELSEALGKPAVLDNRGGAPGSIGGTEVARFAPDGYTWLFAWDAEAANQTTTRLPYKVLQAFAPTTLVAQGRWPRRSRRAGRGAASRTWLRPPNRPWPPS